MSRLSSWPDAARWRAYARFLGWFYLFFVPVYAGLGWLLPRWPRSGWALYLPWEPALPLLPWMVWPYLSLYPMFVLPLLHLAPAQMKALSRQSTAVLLVAAACFIAVPALNGFAPQAVTGVQGWLLAGMARVDTPGNLVPSLHVAFSVLILRACRAQVGPRLARAYDAWLLLLAASTVLVHQHHLLDVAAGAALAWAVRRRLPITQPDDAGAATRPAQSR